MLTILLAIVEHAQTQQRVKDIALTALGEFLFFDAPMAVILFIMWSNAVQK